MSSRTEKDEANKNHFGLYSLALQSIGVGSMNEIWIFGLTLTIIGMGGTLLSLWVLSVLISLLKKIFPLEPDRAP